MKISFALLFAATVFYPQTAEAVLTTFTERGTWESAHASGSDYTVDFNSVTTDTSYNDPDAFDAGPFSIASIGTDMRTLSSGTPEPLNLIDVSPFLVSSNTSVNGTTFASSRIGDDATAITITFDQPITAFGGDFASISGVEITLNKIGGGTDSVAIPDNGTAQFFGFATDPDIAYSSLSFGNVVVGVDEFWRMDDLSAVIAVPEPAAVVLLSAVSLGMFLRQRVGRVARTLLAW